MIPPHVDVVAFLEDQHRDIADLLDEMLGMHGLARKRAFGELRRLLTAHEAAEDAILHPFARRTVPFGELVVAARTTEEHVVQKTVAFLDTVDVDSAAFETRFQILRTTLMEHIDLEEREELEHLRHSIDREQLERLGIAAEVVEAIAPASRGPDTLTAHVIDDQDLPK